MKSRIGFVSNSSSSSYVLFIPDDFQPETLDLSNYENPAELLTEIKGFLRAGGLWCVDNDYFSDIRDIFVDQLRFAVAKIDGGADDGDQLIVVNKRRIKELMRIEK
jgi:hypothetical protein